MRSPKSNVAISAQPGRHPFAARDLDLYETPPSAIEALLAVEILPHRIWEPAAGRNAIVNVLRAAGYEVTASDIGCGGAEVDFYADFLTLPVMPAGCAAICTNPPFQRVNTFVRHALDLAPRVYLLLRLAFQESIGRSDILEQSGLRTVYIFRNRLPMMHRAGWSGRRATNATPFAWFCWERGYTGPTTFNRISTTPNKGEQAMVKETKAELLATTKDFEKPEAEKPEITKPETASEETPVTVAKPGVFSLKKFQTTGPAQPLNVKTLLPPLPTRSLKEIGDFARLHHDEANYWSPELCFVYVPVKGSKRDSLHLIEEEEAKEYLSSARIKRMRLALGATPNGVFFLCEVPTQNLDNVWNKTMLECCEQAKTLWTMAESRHAEGLEGYIKRSSDDKDFAPEPDWPTKSLDEIIGFSFEGRIITRANHPHPGLLRLLGKKQQMS
jgi:hypothetical protein